MGKRGPRPAPTKLKMARGNPGRRPLNLKEPKPSSAGPRRPLTLSKLGDTCWRSLIPKLRALGALTKTDTDMLACYCETHARWRAARDWIDKHGVKYPVMGDDGRPKVWKPWPDVNVEAVSRRDLIRLAGEFGMTPSSRTQIGGSDRKDGNELIEFLRHHPSRTRACLDRK